LRLGVDFAVFFGSATGRHRPVANDTVVCPAISRPAERDRPERKDDRAASTDGTAKTNAPHSGIAELPPLFETERENTMMTLFTTLEQGWTTLALVFGGMVFGAIATALVMTYIWTTRQQRIENRGLRLRERIRHRFERLHKRMKQSGVDS
jgi:hypothetical protein